MKPSPVLFACLLLAGALAAQEWTRFRGPNGSGVSNETGYPVEFGKTRNLLWRTPARPGKSSPVLTPKHVFLTAFENGKLYTQCFDRATGKLLWERSVDRARVEPANALNHSAAITPVTDGSSVYAFFPEFGLVAYSAQGKLLWEAPLGPFSNEMGHSSSPILAAGAVILVVDQMVDPYIAAFDHRNGELRWKVSREEMDGYATPLLYQTAGSKPVIVTASRGVLGAHRVDSGERLWSWRKLPSTEVASPILVNDALFLFGYGNDTSNPQFESRLRRYDKNGDGKLTAEEFGSDAYLKGVALFAGDKDGVVTKEEFDWRQSLSNAPSSFVGVQLGKSPTAEPAELWRYERSFVGVIASPLFYKDALYIVRNGGLLTSFDPKTGAVLKAGRLGPLGGYSSSPVAAEGRILIASEEGKIVVVKAAAEWEVLQINDLGEPCHATPALEGGSIYLRTGEALYRFAGER